MGLLFEIGELLWLWVPRRLLNIILWLLLFVFILFVVVFVVALVAYNLGCHPDDNVMK